MEQKDKWFEAIKAQIESLIVTETWDLGQKRQNIFPGRFEYKIKHASYGKIDKIETRYVAKRVKQIEGIFYSNTFAAKSKPITIKILLVLPGIEFFLKSVGYKSSLFACKNRKRRLSRVAKRFWKVRQRWQLVSL